MTQSKFPGVSRQRTETVTTTKSVGLWEAVQTMLEHRIHHLIVVEGSQVVGVISDRDIWARGLDVGRKTLVENSNVGEMMTPLTVAIEDDTSVESVVSMMRSNRVTALPIISEGRLVGIVTDSDLIEVLSHVLNRDSKQGETSTLAGVEAKAKVLLGRPLVQSFLQLLGEAGI